MQEIVKFEIGQELQRRCWGTHSLAVTLAKISNLFSNPASPLSDLDKEQLYQHVKDLRGEASPNVLDGSGLNLLHWAILTERPLIQIEEILNKFPELMNQPTQASDYPVGEASCYVSPLWIAARNRAKSEIVLLLLKKGADPQEKGYWKYDDDGCTRTQSLHSPFKCAVKFNHYDAIKLLTDSELKKCYSRIENESCSCDFFSCFSYSRAKKLESITRFQALISNEYTLEDLKSLAKNYPAVKSGKVGKAYDSLLNAIIKTQTTLILDIRKEITTVLPINEQTNESKDDQILTMVIYG